MPADDLSAAVDGRGSRGSRPGAVVDPYRLKRALWGGKWLLAGAGFAGLVIGFVIAKFAMTSSYQSTAVLRYEGTPQIASMPADEALGTAAAALQQQAVLRRIADESGFPGNLTTLSAFIEYNVNLRGRTLRIKVPGRTSDGAAAFAKTVSEIFIEYHAQRQAKRIEMEIARITKRIDAAEGEAQVARDRYNEFREAHGIADLSTEQESMLNSAAKLRADSELSVSEVRALEAQVQSLESQLANTPETKVVSGASPEREAYQQLRQQLATARATLSESHPKVQALQQQVNQLRAQVRSGGGSSVGDGLLSANTTHEAIGKALRTAKSNLEALRERQRGLAELATKAQARVEAYSEIEGEASGLLAEVKVNENLVQGLRQNETALEDALRNPTSGFVILDPGSVPEYPVRNKLKLIVFGAAPSLLFGLALLFVLWGEFRGLRAQTPAEIAFWGNGPVLGTTTWPNDTNGLEELVAGLDDYAPDARGSVLIVGGSPTETTLAVELAERMNNDWVITGSPSTAPRSPTEGAEPIPIETPPPSGPYPITRASQSTALATRRPARPAEVIRVEPSTDRVSLEAWDGEFEGQALRRAARLANRVLVLVHSGTLSVLELNATRHRLGRDDGIGFLVVGLPEDLRLLQDRAGNVAGFWLKSA